MKREPTLLDRFLARLDEAVSGEDIIVALVVITVTVLMITTV